MAKIVNLVRDARNDATRALELYEAIRVHLDDDAIEKLVEYCYDLLGFESTSDADIAVHVALALEPGDDEFTFHLDLDEYITISWDSEKLEWHEVHEEEPADVAALRATDPLVEPA